ncbi:MAG: hypothetical protein K9L30_07750 [Desulfobacterales bacterium]|nr:hypothetical protein [Desulfobacterales bacterium]
MDVNTMTLSDYIEIVKRRKWSLIIPFCVIFIITALVAQLLPSIFKSTATILIEEQEISEEFVKAPVTSYAEQRIQIINQRIMSSVRLLEIIKEYELYSNYKGKWTTEEIVEKMREDTLLEPISTEVVDPKTGRPGSATIAFTLSYQGKETPQKIYQVANVLTTFFLDENLTVRAQQTEEASQFMEDEMKKVKKEMGLVESKIAEFKERHVNELPEMLTMNIQGLDGIERRIDQMNEQLRSEKEQEGYLQAQLVMVSPELKDKDRLADLKVSLAYLTSRYTDEYPDVIKAKAEIAELEKQIQETKKDSKNAGEAATNPAYVTLSSQLSSTQAEIKSIKKQIDDLEERAEDYQARIEAAPRVEESYKVLTSERDNMQYKYNDLMQKMMEARVSQGLEKEQKGERFTLIDPPRLPEEPYSPNRLAIILIGFVMGIGVGVGVLALKEFSDNSIRSPEALTRLTSFPVLSCVPEFITPAQEIFQKRKLKLSIAGSIAFLVLCILAFHFFVMDLDIFWAKLMRKTVI